MCARQSGVERGGVRWRQGEICPSFLFPIKNIFGENINIHNAEQIFLDVHAINFHVLVADCVCGVVGTSFLVGVGTSFLVVVGQHEDSWVGSILCHIGWTETHYTKTHVEDSAYNAKLPESWRTLSPLVIS